MGKYSLVIVLILGAFNIFAQNTTFEVSDELKFINSSGDTMDHATIGGFNQPQFQPIDIDNDGEKDILIFDRSGEKTLSFIYQESGKYKHQPEYDHIFPRFSAWVVIKDFDNDGKGDLWFKNADQSAISLYRNITQVNDPHVRFEVVREVLRAYNFGRLIDTSDLYSENSNIPAIEDVDGDGDIDFLTLQSVGFGVTLFLNTTVENNLPLNPPVFEENDVCWGDFTEGNTGNEIILERYEFCFRKIYRYLKKHAGGSSMLLIDGDNDGDKDLILGNAGFDNLIYLENGKSDLNMKIDSMIAFDARFPSYDVPVDVSTFPAAFWLDVDRDGAKDLLAAPNLTDKWSGSISEFNNIRYYKNIGSNALPKFKMLDSAWLSEHFVDQGSRTVPLLYDIDSDDDLDLMLAVTQGHSITADMHDALYLYENIGDKSKAVYKLVDTDFLGLDNDSISGMHPTIGDLNNDGKDELLIGEHSGNLRLYSLSGTGKSMTATLVADNAFLINAGFTSAPHIGDVDGDGIDDLLIGNIDGHVLYYNNAPVANVANLTLETDSLGYVIVNELRRGTYYDEVRDTFIDSLLPLPYGYSTPFLRDLDGNGNPELIVGGASGYLKVYANIRNNLSGKFSEYPHGHYLKMNGNDYCYLYDAGGEIYPAVGDLNDDGFLDILVGTNRGGLNYFKGKGEICATSTGSFPFDNELFTIYPNPALDKLYLKSDYSGKRIVQIFSTHGQLLSFERTTSDITDISRLKEGMYFVRYQFGNHVISGSFIKK